MKITKITNIFLFALTVVLLASCAKDENEKLQGAFSNGVFIVNEGPFQTGTGTITFFKPDSNLVKQDIFETVNGRPLGNIAQSMTIHDDKGYIVVNNAGSVEVVNAATFKSEGTITGFANPAQFLAINSTKAYVTDWAGSVAVVDLTTKTIKSTIQTGTGPDAMIRSGNMVLVANTGGFGVDSTISIIDLSTDKVVKTIVVGEAPGAMVVDRDGKIWVICKGIGFAGWPMPGDTPGRLVRIDPNTFTVDFTYKFPSEGDHPEKLVINKEKSVLYFLHNNGIYNFNTTFDKTTPELLVSRYFYSLGYENKTGYLYASDPKDFINNGQVLRINSNSGAIIDSIAAGISPRAFVFAE